MQFQLKERLGRFTPKEKRSSTSKKALHIAGDTPLSFDTQQWNVDEEDLDAKVTLRNLERLNI